MHKVDTQVGPQVEKQFPLGFLTETSEASSLNLPIKQKHSLGHSQGWGDGVVRTPSSPGVNYTGNSILTPFLLKSYSRVYKPHYHLSPGKFIYFRSFILLDYSQWSSSFRVFAFSLSFDIIICDAHKRY